MVICSDVKFKPDVAESAEVPGRATEVLSLHIRQDPDRKYRYS